MEREVIRDIPDPEATQVVQIGREVLEDFELPLFTTRGFIDDLQSGNHLHREENLSINMIMSPDPFPKLTEVMINRSPHVLPPDEFNGKNVWWEKRMASNDDMRQAVPILDPLDPKRPDFEDEPREPQLVKNVLEAQDKYAHATLVLGLTDVLVSCAADCGGMLPVGLIRQLFTFLPNLESHSSVSTRSNPVTWSRFACPPTLEFPTCSL